MWKLRATLAAIVAIATVPARADGGAGNGYWHGMGWGGMMFGSLMMLIFWGVLIVLIALAVRWVAGAGAGGSTPWGRRNRAREILEERFARGEIDEEEFEKRKRLLAD